MNVIQKHRRSAQAEARAGVKRRIWVELQSDNRSDAMLRILCAALDRYKS